MRKVTLVAALLGWLLSLQTAFAQDASAQFTSEIGSLLIGEPIPLILTISVPAGSTVNLPTFPAEWPPFMVREVGQVSQRTDAERDVYVQQLTVILWEPGEYQTPSTLIEYQLPASTELIQLEVQPAYFDVRSVLNADDLNLRPLKPPVALFYVSPWLVGLLGILLVVVAFYVWKSRQRFMPSLAVLRTDDKLHIAARTALTDLKQVSERNWSVVKAYTFSGDVLRRYVQGRFGTKATDMTTEELLSILTRQPELSERRQRELSYLLEQADLVKFARVQPKSAGKIVDVAQRWIVAVEQEQVEAAE